MNRNKQARLKFSKEDNELAYKAKSDELDSLLDDNSEFRHFSGKRLLVDKSTEKRYVSIRVRKGYVECYVSNTNNGVTVTQSYGRFILGVSDKSLKVDHINRNPLDNRLCNLKVCTQSENLSNRLKYSKLNQYKGYTKSKMSISVECQFRGIRRTVKIMTINERYAAILYDCMALTYHGIFAAINFDKNIYSPEFIDWVMSKHKNRIETKTY